MKTVLLLAALLFALSSRLFALSAEREASKSLPGQSATLADLWRRGQLCQAANQHRARCHGSDKESQNSKKARIPRNIASIECRLEDLEAVTWSHIEFLQHFVERVFGILSMNNLKTIDVPTLQFLFVGGRYHSPF
jgi:hypothetical protein